MKEGVRSRVPVADQNVGAQHVYKNKNDGPGKDPKDPHRFSEFRTVDKRNKKRGKPD